MKSETIFIIWILGTLGVISLASYMAINHIDGWGWFLFVGALMLIGISYKSSDSDGEKEESEIDN